MKPFFSSFFSTAKKTSDKKQLHTQAAPAYGDSGNAPQVNCPNKPQPETVNRELGHVNLNEDGGQPPSVSAMRPVVVSQPSGNPMSTGGQPPSLNDVRRRETSQTGASLIGDRAMVDEQELAGMSLVGNRFRDVFPMGYRKLNDE